MRLCKRRIAHVLCLRSVPNPLILYLLGDVFNLACLAFLSCSSVCCWGQILLLWSSTQHFVLTSAVIACLTLTCRTKAAFFAFYGDFWKPGYRWQWSKTCPCEIWGRDMRGMDRMSLNEKPSFWYRRLVKLQPFSFWAEELKCHMGWAQLCHCLKSIVRWDLSMSEWLTSKLDPKFLKAPNKMSTYSFSKNSWSLLSFQGVSFLCRGCYK